MNNPKDHSGRLEVICGPMFAGKTTELIRRLSQSPAARAFKPARDTRYSAAEIVTHGGGRLAARPIADVRELPAPGPEAALIGIDEAHFFGAGLVEPVLALVRRGARVIVAGVERDHRGEPFEPFPRLLVEADEVVKLHAVCAVCGAPAVHTQRMIGDDSAIVVGGAEIYQPRCRVCFGR